MRVLLPVLLLTFASASHASHIFGADFFYTWQSANTYQVTLVLYGDCGGSSFPSLPGNTPQIEVSDNGQLWQTFYLNNTGIYSGELVSQVCPDELQNTTCSGGVLPGVKRFVYTGIIGLPYASANWKFRFNGKLSTANSYQAGRSNSITNIYGVSNSIMALEATLNNLYAPNNAPLFTTLPTPFYCINTEQAYNQGAVDADGDSLGYALVPALEGNTGGVVNYVTGTTANKPLITAQGSFQFNSANGQMTFLPNAVQKSVVVNKVTEYRNGVPVGTSMREMTFIVLGTCDNTAPTARLSDVSNLQGGILDTAHGTINVCSGASQLAFDMQPSDLNGDMIQVSLSGLPNGSTATVDNNGGPNPVVHFSWPMASAPVGSYTFFVTFKDDGCPLSSQQTKAFTIRIIPPPTVGITLVQPTQCSHQAAVQYDFTGVPPYLVQVLQNGNVVEEFTAYTNNFVDSLPAGNHTIRVSVGAGGCDTILTTIIPDSGVYPVGPQTADSVFYCTGDAATQLQAQPAPQGTVQWYTVTGQPIPAPVPSTGSAGAQTFLVSQTVGACTSLPDTVLVFVTDKPTVSIASLPGSLCTGDTVRIAATTTGGVLSASFDGGNVVGGVPGDWQVVWNTGGTKQVNILATDRGCAGNPVSTSLTIQERPLAAFDLSTPLCSDEEITVHYTGSILPGQQFTWSYSTAQAGGSAGPGPFTIRYPAGEQWIRLETTANGCTDSTFRSILVNPIPSIPNTLSGGVACLGDLIELPQGSAGATYNWEPASELVIHPNGKLYVRIMQPVTLYLEATSTAGCSVEDTIVYTDVEPCCTFSYPTAFTPNSDGVNDRFHPVLYGNAHYYDLKIYDRWGKQVFHAADAGAAWDGTSNGKNCDAGVYFYVLRAKCLTGKAEEYKGDVTLIR